MSKEKETMTMSKTIHHMTRLLGCMFLLLALTACSSKSLTIFPTKIKVQILASHEINPDINNRPSPLVVRIYELKSADTFNNAEFFQLYDEEAATLGGDLIARQEFEVSPGEGRELMFKPQDNTRVFAVLAAFRNIDQAVWRTTAELKLNKTNTFIVKIDKQSVTIDHK
ncbi:MAG TPA: type VI secretion system lipoprotein TssJ [Chromatiales bacterium]|nr:type VI secretion system lipoprotein TssJ [Chromatiales bacterium]HEX23041.1 type VI secretion system lipoprotein TssJ [Chromatiales bacterium]